MELVVLGTTGVPNQSIISIRAGSTRRQAPLASVDKPFKFPCKPEECGTIKVDFFNLAGSGRALCHGSERRYSLQLERPQDAPRAGEIGDAGDMEFSFLVRPAGSDPDGRPDEGKMANKAREAARKQAWTHTETYLEDHHILTFMQSMLQSLIKEKPDDPYGFLSRQFLAHSKDTCPGELTGLPNPDCGGSESKGLSAEATLAMPPLPKIIRAPSMMSSRTSSKACLAEPGPEPSLVGASGSVVGGGSVKDVHEQVQKLQDLQTEIASLREVVGELVERIPQANRLLRANSRMRQRLVSAGDILDQELSDDEAFALTQDGFAIQKPDAPACEGPHNAPKGLDGEELRRTACETLMAAAESGELTLAVAQATGSTKLSRAAEVENIRQLAGASIADAAARGDLRKILAQSREHPQEARCSSGSGSDDDEDEPEEEDDEGEDVEDLRAMASSTLLGAVADGSLPQVLAQARPRSSGGSAAAAPPNEVGSCASPTATSDLKVQAKAMLMKAAKNGDFMQLLATTRSLSTDDKDVEGTRQQIRDILRQGADSGELRHVLRSQCHRAEASQAKASPTSSQPFREYYLTQRLPEACSGSAWKNLYTKFEPQTQTLAVAKPPLAPASASATPARGDAPSPPKVGRSKNANSADMQRVRNELAGLAQDKALLMAEVHKIRAMIANISNENEHLKDKISSSPMCSHTAGFGNAGAR